MILTEMGWAMDDQQIKEALIFLDEDFNGTIEFEEFLRFREPVSLLMEVSRCLCQHDPCCSIATALRVHLAFICTEQVVAVGRFCLGMVHRPCTRHRSYACAHRGVVVCRYCWEVKIKKSSKFGRKKFKPTYCLRHSGQGDVEMLL